MYKAFGNFVQNALIDINFYCAPCPIFGGEVVFFYRTSWSIKTKIMKLTTLLGNVLFVCVLLSCKTGFAQTSSSVQATALQNGPNGTAIMAYYTAFEKKDWNLIQQFLAPGFTFSSPLDNHISLKTFKSRCWPNCYKMKNFEITQVVMNGDDAFVITNAWTTDGKLFRNSDYFTFKEGKISTYECFFGPGINFPNSGK
jgi:SnoaL-like domain